MGVRVTATAAMLLAGCFNPDLSETDIRCDVDGICPFGLVCDADSVCQSSRGGDGDGDGDAGVPTACADEDLGSALGAPVASGELDDHDDDFGGCDSGRDASDATFAWTAPGDGSFRFTTCGSSYDSVLFIHADCSGDDRLGCDDDSCPMGDLHELIELDLAAGTELVVVVGGFAGETGSFQLNIEQL